MCVPPEVSRGCLRGSIKHDLPHKARPAEEKRERKERYRGSAYKLKNGSCGCEAFVRVLRRKGAGKVSIRVVCKHLLLIVIPFFPGGGYTDAGGLGSVWIYLYASAEAFISNQPHPDCFGEVMG